MRLLPQYTALDGIESLTGSRLCVECVLLQCAPILPDEVLTKLHAVARHPEAARTVMRFAKFCLGFEEEDFGHACDYRAISDRTDVDVFQEKSVSDVCTVGLESSVSHCGERVVFFFTA